MSRIGNKSVEIPAGVKVTLVDGVVTVEGKAKLSYKLPSLVEVVLEEKLVHVKQASDDRESSAMQGLARSLIHNMIVGVSAGFKKELSIVGVGYKAQLQGNNLLLNLGYSHPINFAVPAGIKIAVTDNNKITIEGADKQQVGQTAATIRSFRSPEPYKGKGIRYTDEVVIIKEGKSA